jgi:hypothetical protein
MRFFILFFFLKITIKKEIIINFSILNFFLENGGLAHFDIIKGRELYNKPLYKAENIHSLLELNQVALYEDENWYYLHADPFSMADSELGSKIKLFKRDLFNNYDTENITIIITDTPFDEPLPPSSVQTFLKHGIKVPSLVLSNHLNGYKNKYYNSMFDDATQIGYTKDPNEFALKMQQLTSLISSSLRRTLNGRRSPNLPTPDLELIKTLSHCFFVNISCDWFNYIRDHHSTVASQHQTFYPLYISVAYPSITSAHFEYIRVIERLLAYVTGEKANASTRQECEKLREAEDYVTFEWFEKVENTTYESICKRTTRFTTKAMSPVFANKEQPNWNLNYSTWTESIWTLPTSRIFLAPTRVQERGTFVCGLFILIVSAVLISFVNKNSARIFLGLRQTSTESSTTC